MTLQEVLHAHIPSLKPESTFRDAVDKMDIYQFPALVIVNRDQEPVAVITEGDLSRAISQHDSVIKLGSSNIMPFATPTPTTAKIEMEVGDALHLMLAQGLTILPVTDGAMLMGIVLRVDLMQAILSDVEIPNPEIQSTD